MPVTTRRQLEETEVSSSPLGPNYVPENHAQIQERLWRYDTAIIDGMVSLDLSKGQDALRRFFRLLNRNPKWESSSNKDKIGYLIDSLIGKNPDDLKGLIGKFETMETEVDQNEEWIDVLSKIIEIIVWSQKKTNYQLPRKIYQQNWVTWGNIIIGTVCLGDVEWGTVISAIRQRPPHTFMASEFRDFEYGKRIKDVKFILRKVCETLDNMNIGNESNDKKRQSPKPGSTNEKVPCGHCGLTNHREDKCFKNKEKEEIKSVNLIKECSDYFKHFDRTVYLNGIKINAIYDTGADVNIISIEEIGNIQTATSHITFEKHNKKILGADNKQLKSKYLVKLCYL